MLKASEYCGMLNAYDYAPVMRVCNKTCSAGSWCYWESSRKVAGITRGDIICVEFVNLGRFVMCVLNVKGDRKPPQHWKAAKGIGRPHVAQMDVVSQTMDPMPQVSDKLIVRTMFRAHCSGSPGALPLIYGTNFNCWLPVLGGISMPPEVISSYNVPSNSTRTYPILYKMCELAAKIRRCMQVSSTSQGSMASASASSSSASASTFRTTPSYRNWIEFKDVAHFSVGLFSPVDDSRYGKAFARGRAARAANGFQLILAPTTANLLCTALWSADSPLWSMVTYMCICAHQGGIIVPIVGPVGAGKSTSILAFAVLNRCVGGRGNMCVLCASNSPLDSLAIEAANTWSDTSIADSPEEVWSTRFATEFADYVRSERLSESASRRSAVSLGTVKRVCASSYFLKISAPNAGYMESYSDVFVDSGASGGSNNIPSECCLIVTTVAVIGKTNAYGDAVIPSSVCDFVFLDESQNFDGDSQMCVPHVLNPEGANAVIIGDTTQIDPHQGGDVRETAFGHLARQALGLIWNMPFESAKPLRDVLTALSRLRSTRGTTLEVGYREDWDDDNEVLVLLCDPALKGRLTVAQAYAMDKVPFPALMFVTSQRIRSEGTVMLGPIFYPDAKASPDSGIQGQNGPLGSGPGTVRYSKLKPWLPPFVFIRLDDCLPMNRWRGDNRPDVHWRAIQASFSLASQYALKYGQELTANLPFGVVIAHEKTERAFCHELRRLKAKARFKYDLPSSDDTRLEAHGSSPTKGQGKPQAVRFQIKGVAKDKDNKGTGKGGKGQSKVRTAPDEEESKSSEFMLFVQSKSYAEARLKYGPDVYVFYVKPIKGQTAISMNCLAAVAMLCKFSRRFSGRANRFLVWISRAKHTTFILGRKPEDYEKCNAKDFLDLVCDLDWVQDSQEVRTLDESQDSREVRTLDESWAEDVLLHFNAQKPKTREEIWNVIRTKKFLPLENVRRFSRLRPLGSRFPWTFNAVPIEASPQEDVEMEEDADEVDEDEDEGPPEYVVDISDERYWCAWSVLTLDDMFTVDSILRACREMSCKAWVYVRLSYRGILNEMSDVQEAIEGSNYSVPSTADVLAEYFYELVLQGNAKWKEITGGSHDSQVPRDFAKLEYWQKLFSSCSTSNADVLTRAINLVYQHPSGEPSPSPGRQNRVKQFTLVMPLVSALRLLLPARLLRTRYLRGDALFPAEFSLPRPEKASRCYQEAASKTIDPRRIWCGKKGEYMEIVWGRDQSAKMGWERVGMLARVAHCGLASGNKWEAVSRNGWCAVRQTKKANYEPGPA